MSQLDTFMREKHYKQGSYQQVVEDLKKLIAADPRNALLYKLRADAYLQLKKEQLAILDYSKAIEINPENYKAYCSRGIAYISLNKFNEAIADYSKAIKIDPKFHKAYCNRGNAYRSLNKYNEAIADYSKAIEIDPKFHVAYCNRGKTYDSLNKYNEAIADYSKVIEIDPKYQAVYYIRGMAYGSMNKYNEAIADYSKAIKIDPKFQAAYCNRGIAYKGLNQYNEAIADYSKAIEIDPKDQVAYYNRGIAYDSLNKYNEAIADYSEAIKIDPKFHVAYCNRGNVYGSMNQYNEAIADYSKAIEINPKFQVAYYNRGNVYRSWYKYNDAQTDYLKAIQISPNHPLYLLNLGKLYLTIDKKQNAKEYFLKGIASFQRSTKKQLNQKYKLSEGNIKFIKNTIQEFETNNEQIEKLRREAKNQNRKDLTQELLQLDQINAEVGLLKVAYHQLEDKQNKEKGQIQQLKDQRDKQNKKKGQLQQLKDQLTQYKLLFNQKLEQMQKQMKKMFNIQKEQIQTLKNQNQAFKQQQKDLKQRFDIFEEKMQQEVNKMSQKIFAVQRVMKIIKNFRDSKQREYYRNLYNIIINHFLAYRVSSTGFFTQNIKSLSTADGVLQNLCKAQPIIEKIPIIGDLIGVPFQIISTYRQQKSSHINSIIAGKIMASELKTESLITQFMAHVIQQLIDNQHFNEQLKKALKEEKGSFIGKIQAFVKDKKSQLYSKVFGTNSQSFSYVNKVVVSHMTLLTLRLCEIDEEQFVEISKDKAKFYSMVIETISPDSNEQLFNQFREYRPKLQNQIRPTQEPRPQENKKCFWFYLCCFGTSTRKDT